jgi:two-component system, NarL family, invasion response regulator UvrY
MAKKTIVIVDDHVLVAKAIASLIDQMEKYEVLFEAENGLLFVEWLKKRKHMPDIVLLDINMPKMNGYETATWLKNNHPEILVIALTMFNDEPSIINMIKAGVSGYLLKDIHPVELEKALDFVIEKGFYYSEWVANRLIKTITDDGTPGQLSAKLTEKERHFLTLVCSEMTYKEIAHEMKLSTRTVEGYRDQLFTKLNVKSRVGLVLYAIKTQLFQI